MCTCVSCVITKSVNNPLRMSSPNKKRRKNSFFHKLRRVFKKKDDELEKQAEFYRQEKTFDNRRTDNLESVSCNSGQKVAPKIVENSETCVTVVESSPSEKETFNLANKNSSNMQRDCKNVTTEKNKNSSFNAITNDNKSANRQTYNVAKNEQEDSKLGSDRHMNTKIAFLKQENIDVTFQSDLGDTDKLRYNNETENCNPDSPSATLQSLSNNANITSDKCKFLVKETKVISQESSEDSDFSDSTDSTEDSFQESSEDENDLIESEKIQKKFKDEYFTKGKYITYFFLEMERQFYNPMEVYSMVHYHDTDCEKLRKEGTK